MTSRRTLTLQTRTSYSCRAGARLRFSPWSARQLVCSLSLRQTEEVLLVKHQREVRAHRHEALAQLAALLDADGAAVDSASLRFEFGQPLPKGLLPFAINRCGQLCGEETSVWRHDIVTINPGHSRRRLAEAEQTAALMRAEGRPHPALETDIATLRAEVASIGDGVQVEVSVGQQGPSAIGMAARCQAGGRHALCQQLLQPLKQQLGTALEERWPGCSPSVTEEGVPPEPEPEPLGADFEPEPEPMG